MTPEEIKALLNTMKTEIVASVKAEVATAVKSEVETATKPFAELPGRLTALEEAATAPKPKDGKPGDKDKPAAGGEGDGVLAKVHELLKPLQDRFGQMDAEKQTAEQRAKTEQAVVAYLAANHPYLKGKPLERAKARLVAMAPADTDAVKAAMASYHEELADMGVDTKPFTAEPKKEGAVETANLSDAEQRVAEIRQRGPVSTV